MVADLPDYGRLAWSVCGSHVSTSGATFMASLDTPFVMRVAYDPHGSDPMPPTAADLPRARSACDAFWRARIANLSPGTPAVPHHELAWSLMLAAGTAVADGTRGRLCLTNGALYAFNHLSNDAWQPGGMYSFRDGNQVAFGLARTFPELARDQLLRTVEAFDTESGIPQMSTAAPGVPYLRYAPGGEFETPADSCFSSDQVWWWLIALTEYIAVSNDSEILAETVCDASGHEATVRQHLDRLVRFAVERVGFGAHGLPRFLAGDWSDYLGRVGSRGRGESFMNAGLLVVACERTAARLRLRGEAVAADALTALAAGQHQACAPFCSGPWFPRATDDDGAVVGDGDDRLYMDSQPWLVLARVGDAAMRKRALLACVERLMTPIGPKLIDRPLQYAEIANRSNVYYPPGSGENGGVWVLTGWWLAMALAAEGLTAEADAVAAACARDRHHALYPDEWWSPFMAPDGIDGPDSVHYGKSQQAADAYPQPWAQGFMRECNPNEVAKYPFQLWYAANRGRALLPL